MCNKQVGAILTGEIFATETRDFCGESWGRGRVFDVKVKVKVKFDWEKNQNSKPQKKKTKKKTSYFNLRKIILTNPFFLTILSPVAASKNKTFCLLQHMHSI